MTQIVVKKENEAKARSALMKIGISPVRAVKRGDGSKISLVLPELNDQQILDLEDNFPRELFAVRGVIM